MHGGGVVDFPHGVQAAELKQRRPIAPIRAASYTCNMNKTAIIATLRAHETELRRLGVTSLSLFGSAARGDGRTGSDIDVAVKLDRDAIPHGFRYIGRLEELRERLAGLLGAPVDVVPEPAPKPRFQQQIDRDRVLAF
jgi:uncharacterized protein